MLKLTFCLRRKADMSREGFLAYWKDDHGPRVISNLKAMGCRKYVQVKALDGKHAGAVARSRGGPEPSDGVAELWFDDADSFMAHSGTADGKAAAKDLYRDEQNFIDLEASVIFLSEQQLVVEPAE
jgi:uncharacterized protein (TIGR02118 family)